MNWRCLFIMWRGHGVDMQTSAHQETELQETEFELLVITMVLSSCDRLHECW